MEIGQKLSKVEALEAMKEGWLIKHEYYTDEEFLYMKNGYIFDEAGYNLGTPKDRFWAVIQKWEGGWFISGRRDSCGK